MQLVERGTVDLDAPVSRYVHDFRPSGAGASAITLRQLMSHRAGLVREPPVGHYFDNSSPSLEATVRSLNDTRLVYRPGAKTKYSNAGVAVAGLALASTEQRRFPEYLADVVLPAWLYIGLRGLDGWRRNRKWSLGPLTRSPETAGVLLFVGATATELSQAYWPSSARC